MSEYLSALCSLGFIISCRLTKAAVARLATDNGSDPLPRRHFYLPPERVVVAGVFELFSDVSSQIPIFRSLLFITGFNEAASHDFFLILKNGSRVILALCLHPATAKKNNTYSIQVKLLLRLYFNMFAS